MGRIGPLPTEFSTFVEEHLGLNADSCTSHDWGKILQQRLGATRSPDFESYRQRLALTTSRREEIAQLAQGLTVGETYFFRDSRQFEALTTVVLPDLLNRRAANVRVLSVACSTGEEPYSVAIAARELLASRADRIRIHAFDVNPNAIAIADRATYSEWALRATPAALRDRYFSRRNNQHKLAPAIRDAVTFEVRNLFDEDPGFWRCAQFDVILCRNVLIYFSRRKITAALRRLTDAMAADGTILLGSAETPRSFEERLIPQEVCGSFCYRLPLGKTRERVPTSANIAVSLGDEDPPPALDQVQQLPDANLSLKDGTWVTAIEAATGRLARLIASTPTTVSPVQPAAAGFNRDARLDAAHELIASERYSEALGKLDEIVAAGQGGGQVDLLRASILTNQGRFVESSDLCRRLLAEEPHSAGAYHLLAVASEHIGRLDDARSQHEIAITLDPGFAMSHWLLGRLHLRAGERDQARRYLTNALDLWRLETAPNAAGTDLYAGGFGRDALEHLCRADLAHCEVRR
jgi:chemotaxis protein methyltransferase CheR